MVLFDAACPLCTGSARFIVRNDPEGHFRFAALQSPAGRSLAHQAGIPGVQASDASLAVWSRGVWFLRSEAVLEIAAGLRWPLCLLAHLRVVPAGLRDALYGFVARNRRRSACVCAPGRALDGRMLPDGMAAE